MMIKQKVKPIIIHQLQKIKESLYTGRLEIALNQGQRWNFYFRLGRLIWCQGGVNEEERWHRLLKDYYPQLKSFNLDHETPAKKYETLAVLYQNQSLDKEKLIALITSIAQEIIFDLIQISQKEQLSYPKIVGEIPNVLLSLIQLDPILELAQRQWQIWENAGLADYSPNLYPMVQDQKQLEAKWQSAIDGNQTFRGIARKTDNSLLTLITTLIPSIESGAIVLSSNPNPIADHPSQNLASKFLIAGIDDSEAICQQLKSSLTAVGYNVITFQNPTYALSNLIKNPPDLILLDLMMPIINGYELCTQMRRIPKLKEVPVIILTGKDGWIDRARAKMCGASDFLSKPVQKEMLFDTIHQYLPLEK